MLSHTTTRVLAGACAALAWLALALQLALLLATQATVGRGSTYAVLLYLGFFTILTNGFCAAVLTAYTLRPPPRAPNLFCRPWVMTSAAASIAIVGAVYFLVLRHAWEPAGLQRVVDIALHYIVPLLFLAFWWAAVRRGFLRWADLTRMLLYPLLYLVYVFVRGALTGLYPYFFIDVHDIGYGAAMRNALGMLLAYVAVSALLVLLKRPVRPEDRAAP